MRIKVRTHGHQFYSESEGEVLIWLQTVEKFDGKYLQVPAVILDTEEGPHTISLKQEYYWSEIEKVKGEPDAK